MSTTTRGRRRLVLVASTVAAVLLGSGVAVAYWTTTGSGTGSGTVGTSSALTVTQTGSISGLTPGGAAQPIDLSISSSTPGQVVSSVSVTVSGTSNAGCTSADFAVVQPTIGAQTALNVGANAFPSSSTGATIQMVNRSQNQDACKGVTVNLAFAAS